MEILSKWTLGTLVISAAINRMNLKFSPLIINLLNFYHILIRKYPKHKNKMNYICYSEKKVPTQEEEDTSKSILRNIIDMYCCCPIRLRIRIDQYNSKLIHPFLTETGPRRRGDISIIIKSISWHHRIILKHKNKRNPVCYSKQIAPS